jgi:glucan phosphoethanolaminetransferase (alkaline phosphatase superfamily)
LIVDESVRGDSLSLNGYSRVTTPFLDELYKKGLVKNWGVTVSGTTCSKTSNNLLLTGLNQLPDTAFKVYQLPTIFQYAKAMGYKTYSFDGQVSQIWNGKPSDLESLDKRIAVDEFRGKKNYEIDAEIARQVREITSKSVGNFIWVNKAGVHKPYQFSYPSSETVWLPTGVDDDASAFYSQKTDVEKLRNDYDNALLYNSQSFFKNLVAENLNQNTFFVYTSDHGQTLMENGETVSHCSNTRNEAAVPLFIISNSSLLTNADTNFRASHANIFATLLDLMDYPADKIKNDYSISLLKAKENDSQPRSYYFGDLHGRGQSGTNFYDFEPESR